MSRLRNRRETSWAEQSPASIGTIDAAPIALIGTGSNGQITSWNRAATTLLGWQATDVVGRKLSDVLGGDRLAAPRAGSDLTRVRAQVPTASGASVAVEVLADDAHRYLMSGESMVAVIPVASGPTSADAGAPLPIASWVEAAGVIRGIGSGVHCVSVGVVGVDAVNRGDSRATGDAVLREVSARLEGDVRRSRSGSVGSNGRTVRVAGNQFVVVAPAGDHRFPYPHDEAGRLDALYATDVLDTPAEDVYNEIVRAAAELCGTPVSLVSLIDADRQWFKAKVGIDVDETSRDVAFCAHTICGEHLMEVPDTHDDGRFAANPFVLEHPRLRFYAGVPLRSAAGHSYGTLCVLDTVPRLLTPEQRDGLLRLARQVTVLLELRGSINQLSHAYGALELAHRERDAVEANLRHQAHYDPLTGLPNRTLLMEQVEMAFAESAATGQPLAMLICDLDDFKLVNDGLGHPAGDQLLVEVARRLRASVRERDTVARFGGDEFVVVINNANRHTVAMLGTRILDEMAAPISIGGRDDLRPSISIGVAAQTPGINADQLLSNADAAMYRAKELGGGRMCEFDEALGAKIRDRLTMTSEFRGAVTNDELFCLHQPEVDLVNGHLFGLESLVRWRHPTRGVLLPDQFVPMLEATSGTDALFERVLHLTLEAQAGWAAQLGEWPSVAVNVSARQLHDCTLAETIRTAVEKFSVPSESLWLEVTESALASAPTFDVLHDIHRLGVHLAIDDFGVGWSSMARLSLFPWDLLKIDRTFISQLGQTDNAEHVVRGIISLAHSLGIRTSAEGVENVTQLQLLRHAGCDIVQGFLIDRPLPVGEALQRMTVCSSLGRADVIGWNESSGDSQRVQQLFLGMHADEPVDLSQVVPNS